MAATSADQGALLSIWRYPVKSMMGEELNATHVAEKGVLGDRARAMIDRNDGKVASMKNPRKWPNLFDCRARYLETPTPGTKLPPVRITLPDGAELRSDDDDVDAALSRALGKDVRLECREPGQEEVLETTFPNPWTPKLEEYWPDLEGLAYRDEVTDEAMPVGTFFDLATVHLLTTATLDELRSLNPAARFETRRFRPNFVVQPANGNSGFVENDWIGKTVMIGDEVSLEITGPCPRCVMTTLPQGDLPKDTSVLRTVAQHNEVHVGVYASVKRGGVVRRGDTVRLS